MIWRALLILLCVVSVLGCAGKASPYRSTGFVQAGLMTKPADLPFHKAWRKAGVDWSRYQEVYVAPVNSDHLASPEGKNKEDADEIAQYAGRALKEAFEQDPQKRFRVVDTPGPDTLIFEMAIVEAVASKAALEALSYAAGPTVKIIGSVAGAFARQASKSTTAFEARWRDAGTNEVIAMFADREGEKQSLVGVKGLSGHAHTKAIIKEWADQFVHVANQKEGEVIPDSSSFELV